MGSTVNIITAPNPILSTPCRPDFVVNIEVLMEMFKLMIENRGIGLAAPQIGIDARVFITSWGEVFVNPFIEQISSETFESVEGCLSIPESQFKVERYRWLKLKTGQTYHGLQAIVVQHEMDHLNGILISDQGVPC